MRLIARLLTFACLLLALLASYQLWQLFNGPQDGPLDLAAAPAVGQDLMRPHPANQAPNLAPDQATSAPPPRWPALFGEKQPPRPATTPAEPQPLSASADLPPIESLGYVLKGRVQAGDATWAIVDHPSGEQLLRQGDALRADIKVMRIDGQGLWVSRQGGAPELLGFVD
ncbi:type II secretion system protein N [Pseudophaeobacter flagellatus]|uniref:type II secretion system protein N n=1 Tax=Pseudophaeobacter flagellatus TaxID=2899119 RepID=UPI001E29113B|nr:type II secretion system protein N [Pseudophaeobacter flagellatus]MCD9149794.1 hypothetical protein [Pseudophaeobacter flagellatus]